MLLEQHNRIVLLESAVASVKEERNSFMQSMDEVSSDGFNNSGGRVPRSTRFGAAKKVGGAGGTLSSIRQVRRGEANMHAKVNQLYYQQFVYVSDESKLRKF